MTEQQTKQLEKFLKDHRKFANKEFTRSDPYGQGFKRAIDICKDAVESAKQGKRYDPEIGDWVAENA